jgi:hypothetical protein
MPVGLNKDKKNHAARGIIWKNKKFFLKIDIKIPQALPVVNNFLHTC